MLGRFAVLVPVLVACAACSKDETAPPPQPSDTGTIVDTRPETTTDTAVDTTPFDATPPGPTAGTCGATRFAARYGASSASDSLAEEAARGIALDSAGNAYVTGVYKGDADFGGGPRVAGKTDYSLFLAKLDSSGAHVWSKGFGDPSGGVIYAPAARGLAVAADSPGNVVVAGAFAGRIDFGGGTLISAASPPDPDAGIDASDLGGCSTGLIDCSPDAIVAKYDPSGAHQWSRRFGDGDGDAASAVAIDPSGNVVFTGDFHGTVSFGGASLVTPNAKSDIFVTKLDKDGKHVWSVRFGADGDDSGSAIATDSSGNVIVGGFYVGSVAFDATTLTSTATFDGFVAKLDSSNGKVLWVKSLGSSTRGQVMGVAVDSSGNVVASGAFRGSFDFGGTTVNAIYLDDAFVAKLDPSGKPIWTRGFGGDGKDEAAAIALDASGNVHATGRNGSPTGIDFGGGRLGAGLLPSVFVLTLDSSGKHVCSRAYPGKASSGIGGAGGQAIAADANGVVIGGSFGGTLDLGKGPMSSTAGTDIFVGAFAAK